LGRKHKPDPATAKVLQTCLLKLGLKLWKRAKSVFYCYGEVPRGLTAAIRCHTLPKEGMVSMATAVVAHSFLDSGGELVKVGQEFFDGQPVPLTVGCQCLVESVDIGCMVFVVVQTHCLCINHWL